MFLLITLSSCHLGILLCCHVVTLSPWQWECSDILAWHGMTNLAQGHFGLNIPVAMLVQHIRSHDCWDLCYWHSPPFSQALTSALHVIVSIWMLLRAMTLKTSSARGRWPQDGLKMTPRGPKMAPTWPQDDPNSTFQRCRSPPPLSLIFPPA